MNLSSLLLFEGLGLGFLLFEIYRNFDTKDNSVNNRIGAILTWGEMLHNNHHRYWNATSNSQHWSEIDISGWVIKGLKK